MEEDAEPFKASGCATGGNALCCMSPCKLASNAVYNPGTSVSVFLITQRHESAPRIHLAGVALGV